MSITQPVAAAGGLVQAALLVARALSWLAQAAHRCVQLLQRERLQRLTIRTLAALDAHTLRDIGLTPGEIPSIGAEIAGTVEATRERAWREIGTRLL